VGLAPGAINQRDGRASFRADTQQTHGVRLVCVQRDVPIQPTARDATGLDHIVIRSADAERAAALYGARLGLDMRLDRNVAGRRLMFFRCGDAVVEIVEDPSLGGDDKPWGLSWRIADADAQRARLAEAGFDVSEVKPGMKPGTRVFTVRDRTAGAPTLMLEPSGRGRD
jgi:catechol 2,3-dioxygenase-like lactoylglutathione lyase family enzyme